MTFKPPSFMVSDENVDKDLGQPTDSVEQVESINNDTNTKTLDLNKSNFKPLPFLMTPEEKTAYDNQQNIQKPKTVVDEQLRDKAKAVTDGLIIQPLIKFSGTETEVANITQDNINRREKAKKAQLYMLEKGDLLGLAFSEAGNQAGMAWDIAGEGLQIFGQGLYDTVHYLFPEEATDAVKKDITDSWEYLQNSPTGQRLLPLLSQGGDTAYKAYKEFEKTQPVIALKLRSLINLGGLFSPTPKNTNVFGSKINKTPSTEERINKISLKKFGEDLFQKGVSQSAQKAKDEKERVATFWTLPLKPDPKSVEEKRTLNPFKPNRVGVPNSLEKGIIETLTKTDINKKDSGITVRDKLVHYRNNLGKEIEQDLKKYDKQVSFRDQKTTGKTVSATTNVTSPITTFDIKEALEQAFNEVAQSPIAKIADNPENILKGISGLKDQIEKIMLSGKTTNPSVVYASRKEADNFIKKIYGEGALKPIGVDEKQALINTFTLAFRKNINNILENAVPQAEIKRKLRDQFHLFDDTGLKPIYEKIAEEGSSKMLQIASSLKRNYNINLPVNLGAQVATTSMLLGGLGGAKYYGILPYIVGAAAIKMFYNASGKLIASPGTKKLLGKTILGIDKAIRIETSAKIIKQLKLDRAAVLELLKEVEKNKEGVEEQ